ETEAHVAARVLRGDLERLYELALGARRVARLDGKLPRNLGAHFGDFNVVLFAPEDLRVPRGRPAGPRRFLDRSVFNRRVGFLAAAPRVSSALRSRNALLRAPWPDPALLDVYDVQLAEAGARILGARRRYLAEIEPRFAAAYEAITQSGLGATLRYDAEVEAE